MKKRPRGCFILLVAILTLIPIFKIAQNVTDYLSTPNAVSHTRSPARQPHVEQLITHFIRLQRHSDLDKLSPLRKHSLVTTVIITDHYVPQSFANNSGSLKLVHIEMDLLDPSAVRDPLNYAITPFVMISSEEIVEITLEQIRKLREHLTDSTVLVIPRAGDNLQCSRLETYFKKWTLLYDSSTEENCQAATGSFVIFASTKLIRKLPNPWMQSFPDALFIQMAAADIKVKVVRDVDVPIMKHIERLSDATLKYNMYQQLKVKKVIKGKKIEWYGCTRNTTRCFGTVHNDTPDYLLIARWTPPCCLRVLRETARHVFRILDGHKVRYWLEGGSLLGAMRSSDVIPWDFDVDVGAYRDDLLKLPKIKELHKQLDMGHSSPQVVDKHGYVWEMSRPEEGQFYRIQASLANRLHVDIFPFYSRGGVMTKDFWMAHRQDREFPETYLRPLTRVPFIGMRVSAPNNIREFLEFKFGAGCIEHPEYPNPRIISYPKEFYPVTGTPEM